MTVPGCPLCESPGGTLLLQAAKWRLIRADEAGFPAFYRLVWNEHVREFSDLAPADRVACMEVAVQVEKAVRRHLQPTKVNLASLGNAVPHLHWHIIARFDWDSHFPGAVWGAAQRVAPTARLQAVESLLPSLESELVGSLAALA